MLKKQLMSLLLISLGIVTFLTVGVLTASDVLDEIVIENTGYANKKNPEDKTGIKGPVKLSHKKHAEDAKIACDQCHHNDTKEKNTWKEGDPVKKCSECHDPAEKKGKVKKLKIAYHKNCQSCHKKTKELCKAEPYGGYKKCNDCHQKKAK